LFAWIKRHLILVLKVMSLYLKGCPVGIDTPSVATAVGLLDLGPFDPGLSCLITLLRISRFYLREPTFVPSLLRT
jgi:hypothetical protein